ncbi:MAG: YIP1 family protein [Chloroflexi bacterium]|nr:MAG: YIP1 family protein [Chloroflexota bacterium]
MLQPQTYPRLLGQALTLQSDPIVEMVDDDNPWIEGLFFVFVLGLLLAVARLVGGLLLWASLPPSDAVRETLVIGLKQSFPLLFGEQAAAETFLRQIWPWLTPFYAYENGLLGLLILIVTPLGLIGQWLLYASVSHGAARLLGGKGSLGQTLGAVALSLAPRILSVAALVPFVSVSLLLVNGWGLLIAYRGLAVVHDLPTGRAAVAALAPLLLGGLVLALTALFGIGLMTLTGGGA